MGTHTPDISFFNFPTDIQKKAEIYAVIIFSQIAATWLV